MALAVWCYKEVGVAERNQLKTKFATISGRSGRHYLKQKTEIVLAKELFSDNVPYFSQKGWSANLEANDKTISSGTWRELHYELAKYK